MTSWQTSLGNNWLGKTEYESKRKSHQKLKKYVHGKYIYSYIYIPYRYKTGVKLHFTIKSQIRLIDRKRNLHMRRNYSKPYNYSH